MTMTKVQDEVLRSELHCQGSFLLPIMLTPHNKGKESVDFSSYDNDVYNTVHFSNSQLSAKYLVV